MGGTAMLDEKHSEGLAADGQQPFATEIPAKEIVDLDARFRKRFDWNEAVAGSTP